jgi:hypothetical protein
VQNYDCEWFFILGHELFNKKCEFRIHTLFDYIPEDENNPDDQSYTGYLEKRYKGDICHTIMELSFMRIYVVGEETYILNKWSQKLVEIERDINQDHLMKYVDRCSFIMNQRLENQFAHDLAPIFGGGTWQIQRAFAKTLDEVDNDPDFRRSLRYIHPRLEDRETRVNLELYQRSSVDSKDMTRFSSQVCTKVMKISF